MASKLDPSEFVDLDYQDGRRPPAAQQAAPPASGVARAPTREEVESQVADVQAELARLRQAQEQLERERAALEETRRRQAEWKTGREEMVRHLTRGIGLLEEAEFSARQEAEQMAKAVAGLREALNKVQSIQEESWTAENFQTEITRALTTLENARMEWNSARLKFPLLNTPAPEAAGEGNPPASPAAPPALAGMDFWTLSRVGLGLTWPVVLALLTLVMVLLIRGK
ncbi:MAG: hypothetical protein N3J91_15840 [Verrucomicrobiae bacterium]|nr:hypothetical protein [Verrucomicrobiae bacterium]